MSRSISIGYRTAPGARLTDVEIRAPYDLLGTQQSSMRFWSLPVWRELGVAQLAELGHSDPIYFAGWDAMKDLAHEIRLFGENVSAIDFDPGAKASWLAHLVYCHSLLVATAPRESIPQFTIG